MKIAILFLIFFFKFTQQANKFKKITERLQKLNLKEGTAKVE